MVLAKGSAPNVKLDDKFYKLVDKMEVRRRPTLHMPNGQGYGDTNTHGDGRCSICNTRAQWCKWCCATCRQAQFSALVSSQRMARPCGRRCPQPSRYSEPNPVARYGPNRAVLPPRSR